MGKQTEVILSVRCGAAARGGVNEDNCLILSSVGDSSAPVDHVGNGEMITETVLGRNGCLLVVADGMGGMNAGEVASQIAVSTVAEIFRSEKISSKSLTDENIRKFMRLTIQEADKAIKAAGARNPDQQGMGTTIAMLWLVQDKAYYAWCGDSRIYRYHDGTLNQLSSDHSYVCEVLKLSEEEAFNHPDNNIITRSLGNPNEQASPDVAGPEPLREGDLFLLCSDGLCGVLRNSDILNDLQDASSNPEKLNEGNLLLWEDAERHRWHDNVTSLLCYVKSCSQAAPSSPSSISRTLDPNKKSSPTEFLQQRKFDLFKNRNTMIIGIVAVALIFFGVLVHSIHKHRQKSSGKETPTVEQLVSPTPTQPSGSQTPSGQASHAGNAADQSAEPANAQNPAIPDGISTGYANTPSPNLSRLSSSPQSNAAPAAPAKTEATAKEPQQQQTTAEPAEEKKSISKMAAEEMERKKNQTPPPANPNIPVINN